jgi:hypothetical protein
VARRQLLTEEERRLLFGIPHDPDALTRHYSFTRSDRELLTGRRGDANRLGFAVQLALLRHPGMGLAQMEEPVDVLVAWLAERLEIPAAAFTKYAGRLQTMTDHARILAAAPSRTNWWNGSPWIRAAESAERPILRTNRSRSISSPTCLGAATDHVNVPYSSPKSATRARRSRSVPP